MKRYETGRYFREWKSPTTTTFMSLSLIQEGMGPFNLIL